MSTFESKHTVFQGALRPAPATAGIAGPEFVPTSDPAAVKPDRYWTLSQSSVDLQDPESSPSVSMWGFLLASAQTQRLNDISIYVDHGTTSDEIRILYLNDFALTIWREMNKPIRITGRRQRPPRTAVLSFGMPFSE